MLGTELKPNKPTALENVENEGIENDQSLRSGRSQKVPGKVYLLKVKDSPRKIRAMVE